MPDDLELLARETAGELRTYLTAVREIAAGGAPDSAMPMLLLYRSMVLAAGARLGAIGDVVPDERFEPDAGPEADVEPAREGLAALFEGVDDYVEVVDPVLSPDLAECRLSDDVATVCAAIQYGLTHFDAGRYAEAMWWWQYSYLASWGDRAVCVLRVLTSVLAHVRLDADEDVVADAQFDALHVADGKGE